MVSPLAAQLRRLHDHATAGRPANFDLLLTAATELDRLTAANDRLRNELVTLYKLIAERADQ